MGEEGEVREVGKVRGRERRGYHVSFIHNNNISVTDSQYSTEWLG